MKKFKNLLIALFATLCGINAYAYDFEEGDYYYTITSSNKDNPTVQISGFTMKRYKVIIPEEVVYNGVGYKVTSFAYQLFWNHGKVEEVILPSSITEIPDYCFYNISTLQSIVVSSNLTKIGKESFANSGLTEIKLPESLTQIGEGCFAGCNQLRNVDMSSAKSLKQLSKECFSSSGVNEVILPNSISEIGDNCFAYCSSLTNIEIPDSITYINEELFLYCGKLKNIKIPDSVIGIDRVAFDGCSDFILTVDVGSYAAQWAIENNYEYEFTKESLKALGDNPKWAKAYLEYLMGEAFAERYGSGQYGFSNLSFHLLYLDEDDVPELILEGENPYTDFLLCYNNAKVQQVDSFFGLMTRYVPYSGWLETTGMDSTRVFFDTIDRWSKQGGVQSMADGVYAEADNGWGNTEFKCNWDGKDYQNREEYEAAIDAYWIKQGFELSELKEISYYGETRLGNYDETIQFLTQELKKAK